MNEISQAIVSHKKGILNDMEFFILLAMNISSRRSSEVLSRLEPSVRGNFLGWLNEAARSEVVIGGAGMSDAEAKRRKAAVAACLSVVNESKSSNGSDLLLPAREKV
jgi:hypothetical protein